MTRDVGYGLLDDAVAGYLHGGRQRRQLLRCLHREDRPVLRTFVCLGAYGQGGHPLALCLLIDGGDEPQVVQGWWTQAVDKAPHVGERLLGSLREVSERLFGVLR